MVILGILPGSSQMDFYNQISSLSSFSIVGRENAAA